MPAMRWLAAAVAAVACCRGVSARHWLHMPQRRPMLVDNGVMTSFAKSGESSRPQATGQHIFIDDAEHGLDWRSDQEEPSTHYTLLVSAVILILVSASPVLFSEGLKPFLSIILYIVSICFVKVFSKQAFNAGFHYPYTLTAMHMLVTALVASLIERPPVGSALSTLRISVAKAASLGLANSALVFGNAAFVSVISALTPCTTFGVDAFRTWRLDPLRLVSVVVSCVGAGVCCGGDATFSVLALLLTLGACFCRSFKSVWSHDLLEANLGVYALVAWSSIWSFLIMLVVAFCVDGLAPYKTLGALNRRGCVGVVVSCFAATLLNILQCFVLKFLGPVLQSLFGSLELVVVIMLSVVVLGEQVSRLEWVGALLVCAGCASANSDQAIVAMRKKVKSWLSPGRMHPSSSRAQSPDTSCIGSDSRSDLRVMGG